MGSAFSWTASFHPFRRRVKTRVKSQPPILESVLPEPPPGGQNRAAEKKRMANQDSVKNQHYVPQFLLRGFTTGKKHQISVFDKHTGNSFRTSVRNVASGNYFYNFDRDGTEISLDPALTKLDNDAGLIVEKLRREVSLAAISEEERRTLSLYIGAQHARVQNFREMSSHINRTMAEHLRRLGANPNEVKGFKDFSDEENKAFTISIVPRLSAELAPLIHDKAWMLCKTVPSAPFYISDNPVTLQNTSWSDPFYGNIGFGVRGIEIYMPLSSTLSLAMFCRSLEEEMRRNFDLMRRERRWRLKREVSKAEERVGAMVKAVTDGTPFSYEGENVLNHNSMQVAFASRFVFSSTNDFSLVTRMLAENERYRTGPKPEMG